MAAQGKLITALVPFRAGKSRLSHPARLELAQAFCQDVIAACNAAGHIGDVIVVGDGGNGLNGDISAAVQRVQGPVLVVLADQPALTADALDEVAKRMISMGTQALVADAQGIGTTLLFTPEANLLTPRFGQRSRAAHRQLGIVEIDASPRARRDVDDDIDLWDAIRLGVGAHTAAVLAT